MNEGYLLADNGVYKTTDGVNFVKELSFTNGEYTSRFERAGNDLFVTAGNKIFKRSLLTGIKDETKSSTLKIYPNPTSTNFIIEGKKEGRIELLDLTGKIIKEINKDAEKIEIGVSDLSKGIYLLKFNQVTQKLIIN